MSSTAREHADCSDTRRTTASDFRTTAHAGGTVVQWGERHGTWRAIGVGAGLCVVILAVVSCAAGILGEWGVLIGFPQIIVGMLVWTLASGSSGRIAITTAGVSRRVGVISDCIRLVTIRGRVNLSVMPSYHFEGDGVSPSGDWSVVIADAAHNPIETFILATGQVSALLAAVTTAGLPNLTCDLRYWGAG